MIIRIPFIQLKLMERDSQRMRRKTERQREQKENIQRNEMRKTNTIKLGRYREALRKRKRNQKRRDEKNLQTKRRSKMYKL